MNEGIYEELITQLVSNKINELDKETYYINTTKIDKQEAAMILSRHIGQVIQKAFLNIKSDNPIQTQIDIANKIILFLKEELKSENISEDLVQVEGEILRAVFGKIDAHFKDINLHLKEITPYTRLNQSELFTGGNLSISLESELRKEILSSNQIDLLVSFIKFKGIIILEKELIEFTNRGGKLRVITTTYIGATDYKAIQLLSKLQNTEVKISYNSGNERLHAKAYLFQRNTGFHTAYIGSSNFSRSALTDGLEWNLKVTTKEISHIIGRFQQTFNAYWESGDFELFNPDIHEEKLKTALKRANSNIQITGPNSYFDVKPYPFQLEILEKLEVERTIHNRNRNLVVAATGTGKTVISAFDYKRFKDANKTAKLLFIAHRKEILMQAMGTFSGILKDNNFGELWLDGYVPEKNEYLFSSVQTLNNNLEGLNLSPQYFDYIVIDECHHLTANSYRKIIIYFQPKVLLGLTATPERMDGGDIQEDFFNRIAAEIRLPEAMNRKLLCPFQYFGVSDSIDLTKIAWEKGKYVSSELTKVYTANDRRVNEIISALDKYTKDIHETRTLGFCVSIEHARYMAEKFLLLGLKADYLVSSNSEGRSVLKNKLLQKEINYLFVVDIFNEGVDIPEIDTVLFLRPTESLTIFLQQLGRGLRLADNKDSLTVLDFVGNARPEYNFENKFRALIGKTATTVEKEIESNFPHLPLGCSIVLERKAKSSILDNIREATSLRTIQLIQKIKNFEHVTTLNLTLKNFSEFHQIPLQKIYARGSWKRLCQLAGKIEDFDSTYEKEIVSTISNKWLSTESKSYFEFIFKLTKKDFKIDFKMDNQQFILMLYYDIWRDAKKFGSIEESILEIGKNKILVEEIKEVLEILIDRINFKEIDIKLPYQQPLKLHARYTRDQILTAFGFNTFERKSNKQEGVAENKELNTELLFINLIKSEEDFSPTTMYDDYAINETIFHWQSQNQAGPHTSKGISYIKHKETGKIILLFIRESTKDEYKNTPGYVFIGQAHLKSYNGSKPMSINWELQEPLPHYLWKDAAKLVAG